MPAIIRRRMCVLVFIEELTWLEVRDAIKAGKKTVIVAARTVAGVHKAFGPQGTQH